MTDQNDFHINDEGEQSQEVQMGRETDPFLVGKALTTHLQATTLYTGLREGLDNVELRIARELGDIVILFGTSLSVKGCIKEIKAKEGIELDETELEALGQSYRSATTRALNKISDDFLNLVTKGKVPDRTNNLIRLGVWYNFVASRPVFRKEEHFFDPADHRPIIEKLLYKDFYNLRAKDFKDTDVVEMLETAIRISGEIPSFRTRRQFIPMHIDLLKPEAISEMIARRMTRDPRDIERIDVLKGIILGFIEESYPDYMGVNYIEGSQDDDEF